MTRARLTSPRQWHVEVSVRPAAASMLECVINWWQQYLQSGNYHLLIAEQSSVLDLSSAPSDIQAACIKATIMDDDDDDVDSSPSSSRRQTLPDDLRGCAVYAFVLSDEEVCIEELEPTGGDDEWTAGCDNLSLPHKSLEGVWESLIFDFQIKRQLLNHAQSALFFSDKKVSPNIIQWNRMILLHGPPGTGKTTLCRALAHKLAIRQGRRFPRTTLLEIHSHSLFSKWFSTSGKLVSALFQMIRDMVEDDPASLVCVLIDEVESLASSRSNTSTNGDPTDAMRAVNSLLTSLDRLRYFPNVLVLATTNLSGSVDAAFVDRVDLKLYVGLPVLKARLQILRSCVEELIRVGIVHHTGSQQEVFPNLDEIEVESEHKLDVSLDKKDQAGKLLLRCANQAEGLSGRSLRKLPLQAHALFISAGSNAEDRVISLEQFLEALSLAIQNDSGARSGL